MGDESMSTDETMALVKKIMPRTATDLKVVHKSIPKSDVSPSLGDGLAVAQDAAPAGAIEVNGLTREQQMLERNVDLYQVYARINPRILRHFVSRAFIGYPACTILGQHEVVGLCCSMPAEDAIAAGFTLACVSETHKKDDNHITAETTWLEQLAKMTRSALAKTCVKYGTYTRLYGIGIAIPIVELVDGHTFDEPYDPSLIRPGSFKGFNVVDPSRIAWDLDAESMFNPMSEWYQRPEYLRVVTCAGEVSGLGPERRLHRSWCVTVNYREVGEDLLATYMYGGQPLPQILYERVFCADTLANEIVSLSMSKRTVVMDGNKNEILAAPEKVDYFLKRLNYFRTNNSVLLKEPGMQVQQLETSLADLQPLSAQQFQYCAAYAGIPMTKLFKNVPSGLQATGQYEVEDYEETIRPIRESYAELMNRYYEMYIHSGYKDRSDLKVEVRFNPFVSPKAHEIQQIDSQKASMACQLSMNNIITVTEARALLKQGQPGAFTILSPKTPELLEKIQEMKDPEKQMQQQMAAQQPGGGAMPPGAGATPENPNFEQNKQVFQQALAEVEQATPDGGQPAEQPSSEIPSEEGKGAEAVPSTAPTPGESSSPEAAETVAPEQPDAPVE